MSDKNYDITGGTPKTPIVGQGAGPKSKDFAMEIKTDAKMSAEEEILAEKQEREIQKMILLGALLQGMKRKPEKYLVN